MSSSQVESEYQDETGEMYLRRKLKEWYSSDQPKHNCDGRGSDNELRPTYGTFKFQLSEAASREIHYLWSKNLENMRKWKGKGERPKEDAKIGLFVGAPGIGKTRNLLELKTILPCHENYAYISFNGETSYSPWEKDTNFDQMVAVRILWGSFEHWNPRFPFRKWAAKFNYKKKFTTVDCLEIIRKKEGPFCLAIDEVSMLNDRAQTACVEITELVLTTETIVFLGGTLQADWEEALMRSRIPSKFLSLAPLSNAQVSNILDNLQPPYAQYFKGWRINTHLRDLLLQIGGVPRLLDDFVKKCDEKFNGHSPPWNWKKMDDCLQEIDRRTDVLGRDTLSQLVKDIILRNEVGRMDFVELKEGSPELRRTYDRLQSQGFIQLVRAHPKNTWFIFVPFVRFRQWVTELESKPKHEAFLDVLSDLMTLKVKWGYWMDFEDVTAKYLQVLICLLSEEEKPTWERFFNMYLKDRPRLRKDIQFIDSPPSIVTCHAMFPKCGSTIQEPHNHNKYKFNDGSVFINARSASFASVFFTCLYGKERRKYLVAIQCKLLEKTEMSKRILNEELDKNVKAMKDYRKAFGDCRDMLTVMLVTAPYTDHADHGNNQSESKAPMTRKRTKEADEPMDDESKDDERNYIILDRRALRKFFPQPLRDYTFRVMSSGRININCAPLDDIKKVFGLNEMQAQKFAEKRKSAGGFLKTAELPFKVRADQSALIEF